MIDAMGLRRGMVGIMRLGPILGLVVGLPLCGIAQAATPDRAVLEDAAARIGEAAQWEVQERSIPSIAVALVTRDGLVVPRAWGHADAARSAPASADLSYRAGSITKLLTDMAVMRLVEAGRLDLDAPVERYLPSFHPGNPYGGAITLRQLMAHRSGLVREPPRGSYFDVAPLGQADAVASLNETTLVAAPGALTKYSNAAVGVVGEVLAQATGKPYAQAVQELVVGPVGMTDSRFDGRALPHPLAYAEMASFDGPRFAAPQFELGLPAAGSLYSTVGDLAKLIRVVLDRGMTASGPILRPETLESMWTPQYPIGGERRYGLGFSVADLDGHRMVGHGGEIYGFATQLLILPDDDVGVIVFSTVDAGPTAKRIGDFALRTLLALEADAAPPVYFRTERIDGDAARRLSGHFARSGGSVDLRVYENRLVLDGPEVAGEVRKAGGRYYVDDVQAFDDSLDISADGATLRLGGETYRRASLGPRPAPPPAEFSGLIGEYGWEHNFLRVYQRDGRPWVRMEWTDYRPMRRVDADRYAFATDASLYMREALVFERDAAGRGVAVSLNGIRFPRRDFGAETRARIHAAVRRIGPDLRREAMAAVPPAEPPAARPSDLVALASVARSIRIDSLYAGDDNFMGAPVYEQAGAWLQRPAAEALARADQALRPAGFGLLVYDGYRPWFVTKMFWDATPPEAHVFVASPAEGSRHNRGAAVDLTMVDLATGQPVVMPSRFDEFSSRAYTNYVGGSDEERWLRETLRGAIEAQGFDVYPQEWWHFDLQGWRAYAIGNRPFSALAAPPR